MSQRRGFSSSTKSTARHTLFGGSHTGSYAPKTASEDAADAAKPNCVRDLLRECGDALCDHGHCARARRKRAAERRRQEEAAGRCGKRTKRGLCGNQAGACSIHDAEKRKSARGEFAW